MTAHPKKLVLCAAVLGLLAPRAGLASEADAFENKVKPVSGQLYQKSGKLELTIPSGVLSLNDQVLATGEGASKRRVLTGAEQRDRKQRARERRSKQRR